MPGNTWWVALAEAPTAARPNRKLVAEGPTEEDAVLALATKLAAAGVDSAIIKTLGPLGPEDRS